MIPPLEEELLDFPAREREAVIQPHSVTDHLRWEPVALMRQWRLTLHWNPPATIYAKIISRAP
ncbi:hypothetical protein GZL_01034 [Streptomyces sp. 769]|nr:hypothetical protein GZL_01034 [Streptomyces sp. 769]